VLENLVPWKLKPEARPRTRAALDVYQAHPDHTAVMPFILEARSERRLVDYEV
jgi:hypothetical protein